MIAKGQSITNFIRVKGVHCTMSYMYEYQFLVCTHIIRHTICLNRPILDELQKLASQLNILLAPHSLEANKDLSYLFAHTTKRRV